MEDVVEEDAGESKVDTAARASAMSIVTAAPPLAIVSIISKGLTIVVAIIGCSILSGCSSSAPSSPQLAYGASSRRPAEHVVRPGETVYHIAHVYGVSVQRLMEANHLSDSRDLRVGQSLLIPGSYLTRRSAPPRAPRARCGTCRARRANSRGRCGRAR